MATTETRRFRLWNFLLSPQGRISRRAYALFIVPATFAPSLLRGAVQYSALHGGTGSVAIAANLALLVLQIALLWPKFASTAKRAHDFGGWGGIGVVGVLPFVASIAYGIYYVLAGRQGLNIAHSPWRLGLNILVYSVWAVTFLLCVIPGTKGANRFGPPPRGPQTQAADVF